MEILIHEEAGKKIAQIFSDSVILNNEQDALNLMADPRLCGAKRLIIEQKNITPDFFELRTRVAGDVLQKFVNYYFKVAIVGDFDNIESKVLKAFVFESNRGNEIFFVDDVNSAKMMLFAAK